MVCPYCKQRLDETAEKHVLACHLHATQEGSENPSISEAFEAKAGKLLNGMYAPVIVLPGQFLTEEEATLVARIWVKSGIQSEGGK